MLTESKNNFNQLEGNFIYKQILARYTLSSSEQLYFDGLNHLEINNDFILKLVDVFRNPASFKIEMLDGFPLATIIEYIERTHNYYISKKLPEIEQSIYLFLQGFETNHPLLKTLKVLYANYYNHLVTHILMEEKHLLPYAKHLWAVLNNGFNTKLYFSKKFNCSLNDFVSNHDDSHELDLSLIQKIVNEYTNNKTNSSIYRILQLQLESFKKDLRVHELIEDYILIPNTRILERKLTQKVKMLTMVN